MKGPRIDLSDRFREVCSVLRRWFIEHGAKFPWRGEVGWYGVLIAEFVLVRTRRHVAERAFRALIERFPEPPALCRADVSDIEAVFRKIGLPMRASRLRETVCRVVEEHGGSIPCEYSKLVEFPGVGDYIARVILQRVCKKHYAFVDVNVIRVLSRVLGSEMGKRAATKLLEEIVEVAELNEVNTALVDVGGVYCTPRNPRCVECPLSRYCAFNKRGQLLT